jgi:hypothetical protein
VAHSGHTVMSADQQQLLPLLCWREGADDGIVRVRGEMAGPGKDANVGESQSVLSMINPPLSPPHTRRTLAWAGMVACGLAA